MTDREQVVKGLECRKNAEMRCGNPCEETGNCKYATMIRDPSGEPYYPYICDRKKLCEDALTLLKEDEEKLRRFTITKRQSVNDDWSGAQGNDLERIKAQAERSEWGIYE